MRLPARPWLFALPILAALVLSYGFDSGHGFVKDDFRWILESRVRSLDDLGRVLMADNGFYRPVVSLSFAVGEWLFGTWSKGYALTNLVILCLCAAALTGFARALGMERGAALLAAGLWSLNPHGVSGLVMWISGRTSGLVTLFALLAGWAFVKGRRWLAAAACMLALLSKEEAFFLPLALTAWAGWPDPGRWSLRRALERGWPLLATLPPYLVLRSQTDAYLPTTAPDYYRFTLDPVAVGRNALEYADRSATFTAAVLLVMALVAVVRPWARLEVAERRCMTLGLLWIAAGFALTLPVPVRSSLYVCLPLAGVALMGATLARSIWLRASPGARSRLVVAALVAPLALVPLHHSRNLRSRRTAELSSAALAQIGSAAPALRGGALLVFEDDARRRPSLRDAFGSLLGPAVTLETGLDAQVEYLPSLGDWTEARIRGAGAAGRPTIRLRLTGGRLEPVNP